MAKTDVRRRSKRVAASKEDVADNAENNTEEPTETSAGTEKDTPVETTKTDMEQETEEAKDEQDSQMDADIEIKGSAPTVMVTFEKNEEGEADMETTTSACDKKADSDSQMDADEKENTPVSVVTSEEKKCEEGEDNEVKKGISSSDQNVKKAVASVKGKRKAESTIEASPPKKRKAINDGFCLYVGNLNFSKTHEEVKTSLASYFMTQSLLVQDIRLDRSKKHAFVDMASEMDLTKALALNGETILDKPLKMAKAKVKYEDEVKVKAPREDKKAKDARTLFVKNIPLTATKTDIHKIFSKSTAMRFLGGTEGPSKGVAFVEFKNQAMAEKSLEKRQGATLQEQVLIVERVGEKHDPKTEEAPAEPEPLPNNTLFVHNIPFNVKEKQLQKVFQKAVSINIPQSNGKRKGIAFVQFSSVADAAEALQSSQNTKISQRELKVQFSKEADTKVLPKTLIVMGLAQKTTVETLQGAFEGAVRARVTLDKDTGLSKGFGFVDFESEENCQAAKKAMEDCEIDGKKVTVTFAKPKGEGVRAAPKAGKGSVADKPTDGKKKKKKKKKAKKGAKAEKTEA
ncbi:nucleolin-like [Genypterus blacodes]|uniref:nucleolin-like n=1 Tax=Genypterus blacodes TaxID=154954 RepID=UPI003F763348